MLTGSETGSSCLGVSLNSKQMLDPQDSMKKPGGKCPPESDWPPLRATLAGVKGVREMTCICMCWYEQVWGTAQLGLRSCLLIPAFGVPFLILDTIDTLEQKA